MDERMIVDMCRAYNGVLLNQPEDQRDQPAAMRAAHSVIAGKVAELEGVVGEAHEAIKASNEYIERLQAYVVATEQFLLTQDGVICGLSGGTDDPGRGAKKAWERFVNAREVFAEVQARAALAPHPERRSERHE